jgi:hypothetical protein
MENEQAQTPQKKEKIPMKRFFNKANKQAYQRAYRKRIEGQYCDCGAPAVLYRSSAFLCARHVREQERSFFDALHNPMCGFPDGGGMPVYALCLPEGAML